MSDKPETKEWTYHHSAKVYQFRFNLSVEGTRLVGIMTVTVPGFISVEDIGNVSMTFGGVSMWIENQNTFSTETVKAWNKAILCHFIMSALIMPHGVKEMCTRWKASL